MEKPRVITVNADGSLGRLMEGDTYVAQYFPELVTPTPPITEPVTPPPGLPVAEVRPDPTKLLAKIIEPLSLVVDQYAEYRIPDSAFTGPVENIDVSDLPGGLRYKGPERMIYGAPTIAGTYTLTVTAVGKGQLAQADLVVNIAATPNIKQPDTIKPAPVDTEPTGWRYNNQTAS